jgi:hypothetical protein
MYIFEYLYYYDKDNPHSVSGEEGWGKWGTALMCPCCPSLSVVTATSPHHHPPLSIIIIHPSPSSSSAPLHHHHLPLSIVVLCSLYVPSRLICRQCSSFLCGHGGGVVVVCCWRWVWGRSCCWQRDCVQRVGTGRTGNGGTYLVS